MTDQWMPGVTRREGSRRGEMLGTGEKLVTWHTIESGYGQPATFWAEYLNKQASETHFVFHPLTGEIVQSLPASSSARTLRGGAGYQTNRHGSVHFQVEVVGRAAQPWTDDLTPAGKAGLKRLMDYFRSHGVPDQWVGGQRPPRFPGPGITRFMPSSDASGHTFHAAWRNNDHGDPGAIADPWAVVGGGSTPAPSNPTPSSGTVYEVTASELNVRATPNGAKTGSLPKGTKWHATGKTSGEWVEGRSPWMLSAGAGAAWVSGQYLKQVSAPAPKPTPAPAPAAGLNLQRGSTGADVLRLQQGLLRVFPAYAGLIKTNGGPNQTFGPATESVVKEFQRRVGITADGIVGPTTRSKLAGFGINF